VALVFAREPEACHRSVAYLREGAPDVPVWLFSTAPPLTETEALCERVVVRRSAFSLLLAAERQSWPRWVAISLAPWTGERSGWAIKAAPFLIPPFRALLLNENGDFLAGSARAIATHARRRWRDALAAAWIRLRHAKHDLREWAHDARDFAWESAGGVIAWVGRRCFDRLRGNEALEVIPPPPSEEVDWAPLRMGGRLWNQPALMDALNAADNRCVVWGEGEPTREMLALFDDPRTFAVARQTHFRAWKRLMLPTAPFRALQEGEAAQVLAPLSEMILVDRVKLLELRAPPARLSGTAWLLLFWRAAAAGWRSYAVGGQSGMREQPDFPVEEAVFFTRALRNRELLRLAPKEPALSRGAVAFRPGHSLERRERPRVLVISPFLPFPLSHGGAVRIWNLCRALADRVDFVLVATREHGETVEYARLGEVFRDVRVVDIDERESKDERLPKQVRHQQSAALRAVVREIAREWAPHLLQVEYTHMAHFRDAAPHVPAILVEHDITFTLYRQLADGQPGAVAEAEYGRWLAFERQALKAYDAVWTVSEQDRDIAARESGRGSRIANVPNGVDVARYVPEPESGEREILYVGSFRHLPNVIGFETLEREVMPLVWRAFPEARLRVVAGPKHETFWKKRALDPRIEMHGFVEDLRPLYARAAAVAVPLQVSAGTNIKVLEAMACGRAVVTTPVGCAGLELRDGEDALIRREHDAFAAALIEVLGDAGLRGRLAATARATAEQRFSWEAIADRAWASYCAVNVAVATLPASGRPG
jgi:glycosyltransferase involved in cell wall biosynthesis